MIQNFARKLKIWTGFWGAGQRKAGRFAAAWNLVVPQEVCERSWEDPS